MLKRVIGVVTVLLLIGAGTAWAQMGSGTVTAKSSDIDIQIFGTLKNYPTFISNPDFNDDQTTYDVLLDENGWLDDWSVRNEARLGFKGTGDHWSFLMIFEADFTYNKANGDRGADKSDPKDSGMTGEDFGLEKMEFTYNFGPFGVETGWQTKVLDIETGGVLYGDDHPYIGLFGHIGKVSWEALYITVQDDVYNLEGGKIIGPLDSDTLDWRVYTGKVKIPVGTFNFTPFYAFSDNDEHNAQVHYFGIEAYGKLGIVTPRAEFVYAVGDEVVGNDDWDVNAYAAFASLELNATPVINPYIGGYFITGDDDANDDEIKAFNPITNISRYAATFGMENAFIYRYVPVLGNHLYSNVSDVLGTTPGYGGIGNSAKAESPGLIALGGGIKGGYQKFAYKAQFVYYLFEDTGALEEALNISDIDSEMGWEADLQLTYAFNNHFSLGYVLSVFDPGDGVQDLRGDDFDQTAILNVIEMKWKF